MDNQKMEQRRKGIEKIFKLMLIVYIVNIVLLALFKIFYLTGLATIDIAPLSDFIIYILATVFMYISQKLAKEGKKAAGIIGIILGLLEVLFAGILWKIFGAILLIDSIMFIMYCKK